MTFIRSNPEKFSSASIIEISENIGTSIATITRFSQKMGCDKLHDLKLAITRDLESSSSQKYKSQYEDITSDDSIFTISQKVFQKNIDSIKDIEKMLKEKDLETVLELMYKARRLIFVGLGGSASVAQDAYHKFIRLGLMGELVTDVHTMGIIASVGKERDVIIAVSNEGANVELNMALRIAKNNHMKLIAVTQFAQSPLAKLADVCLYTLSREFSHKPEPLISRIAEYSLIDLLYVLFCTKSQEKLEENLIKISDNMKQFKNYTD